MKKRYILFLLSLLSVGASAQYSLAGRRIVGLDMAQWDAANGVFNVIDSNVCTYSPMQSWLVKNDNAKFIFTERPGPAMNYDTLLFYAPDPVSNILTLSSRSTQSFSSYYIDESINEGWNGDNQTWYNMSRTLYTYDVSYHMTEKLEQKWAGSWVDDKKTVMTYTGNNMTGITQLTYSGGVWENQTTRGYIYAGNNVMEDSTAYWQTGAWVNNTRSVYSYSSSGVTSMPQHKFTYRWITGAWQNEQDVTYTYNTAGMLDVMEINIWDGSMFKPSAQNTFTFNSMEEATERIVRSWSGGVWANATKEVYQYNMTKLWLEETSIYYWDLTTGAWEYDISSTRYRYRYETYPTDHVPDLTKSSIVATVYPNPTSGHLNIESDWGTAQTCTGAIYDMQGRLVMSWNEPVAAKEYSRSLDVSALSKGAYRLVLRNTSNVAGAYFCIQ